MNIVWFKRDLRTYDNEALKLAASSGHVLPLYIIEPELWTQPDMSYRQYLFLQDSLSDLKKELKNIGLDLVIKQGSAVEILDELSHKHQIDGLYSHQETWNAWTYERDKTILKWAKNKNITWHEPMQNGVIRRLKSRDGWAQTWYNHMNRPCFKPPHKAIMVNEASDILPLPEELGLAADGLIEKQTGGRTEALKLLNSFLYERGEGYTKEMSSPLTAFNSCSRLSAYLAFGCISMREVLQATDKRTLETKKLPYGTKGKWASAMRSFSGRLRWHCHFIQKLEDQPNIEFINMHPAYNGLRENSFNDSYFEAWKTGKTGFPMIDACMRALIATGWLNFRMRAMLMSFASYHLWLDWRKTSKYLAQLFTDYEPGIHYPQVQMQSGTTGINSIRIYNPIKQGIDQDPNGIFIKKWVPELKNMPIDFIHTPWEAPAFINDYPLPIVDEKTARKFAADQVYGLRKQQSHKSVTKQIINKHASRKATQPPKNKAKKKQHTAPNQIELDL